MCHYPGKEEIDEYEMTDVLTLSYTRYLLDEQLIIRRAARNEGITHARRRIYTEFSLHFAT